MERVGEVIGKRERKREIPWRMERVDTSGKGWENINKEEKGKREHVREKLKRERNQKLSVNMG